MFSIHWGLFIKHAPLYPLIKSPAENPTEKAQDTQDEPFPSVTEDEA
jgi:hypothetical protein